MTYLYIYRLTSDTGLAPCVDNGLLSLACCKGGQIRNDKAIHAGLRYRMYLPQAAHKLLIGLLSLGFRRNKKGLDSSVFTFRENH